MKTFEIAKTPEAAVERLVGLHKTSVENLRTALRQFLDDGVVPDPEMRKSGAFAYPELRVRYEPEGSPPPVSRAFGKFSEPGLYTQSITNPELFTDYLVEQLSLLQADYDIEISTGLSETEIALLGPAYTRLVRSACVWVI